MAAIDFCRPKNWVAMTLQGFHYWDMSRCGGLLRTSGVGWGQLLNRTLIGPAVSTYSSCSLVKSLVWWGTLCIFLSVFENVLFGRRSVCPVPSSASCSSLSILFLLFRLTWANRHASSTARNIVLLTTSTVPVHSPSFFSRSSPYVLTALVLTNVVSRMNPRNKIGHAAYRHQRFQ